MVVLNKYLLKMQMLVCMVLISLTNKKEKQDKRLLKKFIWLQVSFLTDKFNFLSVHLADRMLSFLNDWLKDRAINVPICQQLPERLLG